MYFGLYNFVIMIKTEDLPECPAATTIELVGSKWKLLILRSLLQRPFRFSELKRALEGISHKVLASSLHSMEEDGIISRRVYGTKPPKVEYSLTELGQTLRPLLSVMEEWGKFYKSQVNS